MRQHIIPIIAMMFVIAFFGASLLMVTPIEEALARTFHACIDITWGTTATGIPYIVDVSYSEVRHGHLGGHSWNACD